MVSMQRRYCLILIAAVVGVVWLVIDLHLTPSAIPISAPTTSPPVDELALLLDPRPGHKLHVNTRLTSAPVEEPPTAPASEAPVPTLPTEVAALNEPWDLPLTRGINVDVRVQRSYANCPGRLASWRSKEKRFFRVVRERKKMGDCSKRTGMEPTPLFALIDASPRVIDVDAAAAHVREEQAYYERLREELTALYRADGKPPPTRSEALRVYNVASVANSAYLSWKGDTTIPIPSERNPNELVDNPRYSYILNATLISDMRRNWRRESLKTLLRQKKLRRDASGELRINLDALDECAFSAGSPILPSDYKNFSQETYHLVDFAVKELFARHGILSTLFTGTALGALRHHGMYVHDDDTDMHLVPPASTLLNATYRIEDFYADLDAIVESYAVRHMPAFQWYREEILDRSFTSFRQVPWLTLRAVAHANFTLHRDSFLTINRTAKQCAVKYATLNIAEMRRNFHASSCEPNTWYPCVQPSYYFFMPRWVDGDNRSYEYDYPISANDAYEPYKRSSVPPLDVLLQFPTLYTGNARRPVGKLCRCAFDEKDATKPRHGLCPSNLIDLIQIWYGEHWCVPTGAIETARWAGLKAWND